MVKRGECHNTGQPYTRENHARQNQDSEVSVFKGEPEPARHVSAFTPAGYHAPRTVDTLCCSPLRKTCLQQIWENSSLPADVYHRFYITPLHGLLAWYRMCRQHSREGGRSQTASGTLRCSSQPVRSDWPKDTCFHPELRQKSRQSKT